MNIDQTVAQGHHVHSHEDRNLSHHFTTLEQQFDAAKFGMWLFLLTEILLFSGLFCAYIIFKSLHPETFVNAHKELSIPLGTLNTIVLITSSLTMALGINAIQMGKKTRSFWLLVTTILLAAVFLVVKYFEYSHKFELGQLPGKFYTYTGVEGTNPHLFFSIYFAMTGLHGLHVIAGMIVIGWVAYRVAKNEFSPRYYTPVELSGLYWHLVDLIWIYLFPLLYLIG